MASDFCGALLVGGGVGAFGPYGVARSTKTPTLCTGTTLCKKEFFCTLSDFFLIFLSYMSFKLFYPDILERWKTCL